MVDKLKQILLILLLIGAGGFWALLLAQDKPVKNDCTPNQPSILDKHAKLPPKARHAWDRLRAKIYDQTGQDPEAIAGDLKPKPKPCPAVPQPPAVPVNNK